MWRSIIIPYTRAIGRIARIFVIGKRLWWNWNQKFGVYGFGSIGRTVAKIAADLGMNVLVYSRTKKDMPSGYRWVSQEELFRESDVLSSTVP